MRPLKVGLVILVIQTPGTKETLRWPEIRSAAMLAEEVGYDTVWIPDELLWDFEEWGGAHGFWECVAMTGAIAASTSSIGVGTWVLSALHRNPGLTAKVASTLDEISGGRLIFGFGSGHSGSQGKMFGYPPDRVVGRYEEALGIVVPLLREGRADFLGTYHRAESLRQLPEGPRPGAIPIMLGGHGPRTIGLAVAHADIWSAYATASSMPEAFTDMIDLVDRTCERQGRDPATLGRSVGIWVEANGPSNAEEMGLGVPISGSPVQIAETISQFGGMGFTRVELNLWPAGAAAIEKSAQILELLDEA